MDPTESTGFSGFLRQYYDQHDADPAAPPALRPLEHPKLLEQRYDSDRP
jgi:hypothetical protein